MKMCAVCDAIEEIQKLCELPILKAVRDACPKMQASASENDAEMERLARETKEQVIAIVKPLAMPIARKISADLLYEKVVTDSINRALQDRSVELMVDAATLGYAETLDFLNGQIARLEAASVQVDPPMV